MDFRIPSMSEANDEANKWFADPGRTSMTFLTKGLSESTRFLMNEAQLAMDRMMPEEPDLEKQKKDAPGMEAGGGIRAGAQSQYRAGRASTILTSGLASGTPNLSRRTLLGA